MNQKPNFLKKRVAHASTIALTLALAAFHGGSVLADVLTATAPNVNLTDKTGWTPDIPGNYDIIKVNDANYIVDLNVPDFIVGGAYLEHLATFKVSENATLGSVRSSDLNDPKKLSITGVTGKELTLSGAGFNADSVTVEANDYSGLKEVDFASGTFSLSIDPEIEGTEAAPIKISAEMKGATQGTINVLAGDWVLFNSKSVADLGTLNIASKQTVIFDMLDAPANSVLNSSTKMVFGDDSKLILVANNNVKEFKFEQRLGVGVVTPSGTPSGTVVLDVSKSAATKLSGTNGSIGILTTFAKGFRVENTDTNAKNVEIDVPVFANAVSIKGKVNPVFSMEIEAKSVTLDGQDSNEITVKKSSKLGLVKYENNGNAESKFIVDSAGGAVNITANFSSSGKEPVLLIKGTSGVKLSASDESTPVVAGFSSIDLDGNATFAKGEYKPGKVEFKGDVTLTLEDGANVDSEIITSSNGAGALMFADASSANAVERVLSKQVGTEALKLKDLTLGKGVIVRAKEKVYFSGKTTIGDGATLITEQDYTSASLEASADDKGIFRVENGANDIKINLTGSTPPALKLERVVFAGTGGVEFVTTGDGFKAGLIEFDVDSNSKVTLPKTMKLDDIEVKSGYNTTSNVGKQLPTLVVAGTSNVTKQIGGDADHLVDIELDNAVITVNNGNKFFARVTGKKATNEKVTLSSNGEVYGFENVTEVDVSENAKYNNQGNFIVTKFVLEKDAEFSTGGEGLKLSGGGILKENSKFIILSGTVIGDTFKIDGAGANYGTLEFKGDGILNDNIGAGNPLKEVLYTGSNVTIKGTQAAAENFKFNKSNLLVLENSKINGKTEINGNINLENNSLELNGESVWGEDTSIHTKISASGSAGNLVITGALNVDAKGVEIVVDDDKRPLTSALQDVKVLTASSSNLNPSGIKIKGTQILIKYDFRLDPPTTANPHQTVFITSYNDASAVVAAAINDSDLAILKTPEAKQNAEAFSNVNNTGDSATVLMLAGKLNDKEALARVVAGTIDAHRPAIYQESIRRISRGDRILEGRIQNVRDLHLPVSAPDADTAKPELGLVPAVAAGDEARDGVSYGGWVKPFYTYATQKSKDGAPGHRARTLGVSFGVDTMANNNLMVGIAVSIDKTRMKYRGDDQAGSKSDINTLALSLYGAQQLVNNFFVQGSATFGFSKIKDKLLRQSLANSDLRVMATGKYNSMSFAGKVMFGCNAKVADSALVTPMIGVRHIRLFDESYSEVSADLQNNRSFSAKMSHKTDLIVGAGVIGDVVNLSGVMIYPEAHAFLTHKLFGKFAKTSSKLSGQVDPFVGLPDNSSKTSYNVGVGVSVRPDANMEYGIGYDADFASKFVSHTGTLKLRVNF